MPKVSSMKGMGDQTQGAMIVVPSTAVQSMGLGAITGLTSLATQSGQGVEPGKQEA